LLWETLTGREHLMFYGRLKNLRGGALDVVISGHRLNYEDISGAHESLVHMVHILNYHYPYQI
jgi:hypothetical protein